MLKDSIAFRPEVLSDLGIADDEEISVVVLVAGTGVVDATADRHVSRERVFVMTSAIPSTPFLVMKLPVVGERVFAKSRPIRPTGEFMELVSRAG